MRMLFYICVIGFFLFHILSSYGSGNGSSSDSPSLEKILANYWSWILNSPEYDPDGPKPKCIMEIDKQTSFVFFYDSFDTKITNSDCTDNPIPKGYSIIFPLITSSCTQGDVGLYGKPYTELSDCSLNLDRGLINGKVFLDDKIIVDITIINDKRAKKLLLENRLPQYDYYKEIFSKEFVDILVKNTTLVDRSNMWQKPEEIEERDLINYKSVVHCECIIIDTNGLTIGSHTLKYITYLDSEQSSKIESQKQSSKIASGDTWRFESTTSYKFNIQ